MPTDEDAINFAMEDPAPPKDHHELFFQRFKVNCSSFNEVVQRLKWIVMLFFLF